MTVLTGNKSTISSGTRIKPGIFLILGYKFSKNYETSIHVFRWINVEIINKLQSTADCFTNVILFFNLDGLYEECVLYC